MTGQDTGAKRREGRVAPGSGPALMLGLMLVLGLLTAASGVLAQGTKSLPQGRDQAIAEKEMAYLVGLCEGCHGLGGVSAREDVPTLAGRPADELFAEIERFYFYERVCPDVPVDEGDAAQGHMSMCDVTSQINKQEAEALAAHFAAQPASP